MKISKRNKSFWAGDDPVTGAAPEQKATANQ